MVSATTALKINQYFCMTFFIMMTTFPQTLGDGYSMDFYSCPAKAVKGAPKCDSTMMKAFLFGVFSIFGIQIGMTAILCGAMARPSVSKKAQSVTCLVVAFFWAAFIVNDGLWTMKADFPADAMPKESSYMNFVMWAVVSGLCYSGWKDSGSVVPNTNALVPSGKFGLPIIVGCVNLLFYAIPLIFMAEKFVYEGFGREELVGGFTPAVKFLLAQLFKNIGLVCLWNVCIISAVCSVDKEDAAYRILRATSMLGMFNMGAFSKEAIIGLLTGFDDPMRLFFFGTNFAVLFYQTNVWTSHPFKLEARKD